MSDNFKALVVNQKGDKFSREVKSVSKDFLKHGDVLVKVEYSGLNYKDALILKNGAKLVLEIAHSRISRGNPFTIPTFSLPEFNHNFEFDKGIINKELNENFRNSLSTFISNINNGN